MSLYAASGRLQDEYLQADLEELDLSWKEAELPQAERTKHVHGLHPYLGKFIPQLVEIFLHRLFVPGETVLDPFAGSGTTLVEALTYGSPAVGIDIAALNCLMMRVKTRRYDLDEVEAEARQLYAQVESWCRRHGVLEGEPSGDALDLLAEVESEYLQRWYVARARAELMAYRIFLREYRHQDLLRLILSRAARSARNIRHDELDFPKGPVAGPYDCRKHDRTCYPVSEALKFLRRYTDDTLRRLRDFAAQRTGDVTATVVHGDARTWRPDRTVRGIITSPPYVGNIDYHRQHLYAYELLELPRRDEAEIGPKARGASRKARRAYRDAMVDVFDNVSRWVERGGPIVVVANDRHDLYPKIIAESGLDLQAVVRRRVDRRTGRRARAYTESVFVARCT